MTSISKRSNVNEQPKQQTNGSRVRSLRNSTNILSLNLAFADLLMNSEIPFFIYNCLKCGPALGVLGLFCETPPFIMVRCKNSFMYCYFLLKDVNFMDSLVDCQGQLLLLRSLEWQLSGFSPFGTRSK